MAGVHERYENGAQGRGEGKREEARCIGELPRFREKREKGWSEIEEKREEERRREEKRGEERRRGGMHPVLVEV